MKTSRIPHQAKSIEEKARSQVRGVGIILTSLVIAGCGGGGDSGSSGISGVPSSSNTEQISCDSLTGTTVAGGKVISAAAIPAGSYTPTGETTAITGLPAFCRVTVLMRPSVDSNVNVEIWMPRQDWNGRYLATGNGGGAGSIAYVTGLVEGLKRGFAVANTDLGTSPNASQQNDHPERWADFGYRANHEMTVAGKTLISAYYKAAPRSSYFSGCSTGGQQALSIAQRYPQDYNGIIAGSAANNRTHVHTAFLTNSKALTATGTQMSRKQLDMVTNKVLAACVGKDGGAPTDNFLTDPRQCNFDPETLPKCTGAGTSDDSCLTTPQLTALKTFWQGPINPRTGERIFAGNPFGTEGSLFGVPFLSQPAAVASQLYMFKWALGENWNYASFDSDRDMDAVDARLASILNANDPNLTQFKNAGGKLMMYSGVADAGVPFAENVEFYERAIKAQGGDLAATQNFFRYYLIPGMGHCSSTTGGKGPGDFGQAYSPIVPRSQENDIVLKMVDWVENQKTPDSFIAAKYNDATGNSVALERPICTYPKIPKYQGGDATKASSFSCADAPRGNVPLVSPRYLN